ncbi:MAG TPA: tripartite tricarboxylate transporter substrate binding protein [Burkholderiales bacterium]|nr:tripartite tricarboxylate transporter substrate binding protein [Burkholderiales bacterium]
MGKLVWALCMALAAGAGWGQEYPAREIRSICNFAPGSGADIIVRYYSDQLAKLAGKPVLVENKPGAQGSIASAFVAKSPPDGYTIHITPASSTLAAAPHIFKQLPFDPIKDFASVTTINSLTFVVAVDAAKPIKSIQELIQALRQKPGHGFYGTQSNSGQIAAELLKANTGLNTVYVPFKVTGDAFTNLLSGQIDFMSVDSTWAKSQPKVRILAVTAAKRSSTMPEIPTLAEAGVPGVDIAPWWGVVVPAGTPRPIIDKLAGWFNQITASEETRQFLARAALDPFPGSPEQMAGLLKSEVERWGGFVKLAKIQPQ